MEARIAVKGTDADVESLADWLHHEPLLRGRVVRGAGLPRDGEMGTATELLVALVSGAGSGAAAALAGDTVTAMAESLSNWLRERKGQRSCAVTVEVTRPDGSEVSVTIREAADSEPLLRAVLEATTSGLTPPPDSSAEE